MQESENHVAVRRCAEPDRAELYALVLSAKGIESIIVSDAAAFDVLVRSENAAQARAELAAYDAENQRLQRLPADRIRLAPPNWEIVLVYWAVLLFFFAAIRRDALSIPWLDIGAAQVGAIRAGQWWRLVTALFLHVSGVHLLSNLIFGTVFLLVLSQVLGPGMTALAVLAAGAGGNLLNALIRPPFHTSIGASTAIFAAIGLLAALRQGWTRGRMPTGLRDWIPLAGGLMLLAFLGFSGVQTDILAHVLGFASGVGLGTLLVRTGRRRPGDWAVQGTSALAAVMLVVLAWLWAILARG